MADESKTKEAICGQVYTWGGGKRGELGHDNIDKEGVCPFPHPVPGLTQVVSVSCGECASAAVTVDGQLFTWGSGLYGRLGLGNTNNFASPQLVTALKEVFVCAVSVGESHMCCVDSNQQCYFWGNNSKGQLGTGDRLHCHSPVLLLNECDCYSALD